MGNANATFLRGLKKEVNLYKNDFIKEAAEQGNIRALRLLNINEKSYLSNVSKE
jgi:hypothetical protein